VRLPLQGAREQYLVQLLSCIPLMYVRCVFVQYAAVCHYRRFVCVSGAAVRVGSGHRMESNLLTAKSTAHEPPENGHTYVPKHVGTTLLKCF